MHILLNILQKLWTKIQKNQLESFLLKAPLTSNQKLLTWLIELHTVCMIGFMNSFKGHIFWHANQTLLPGLVFLPMLFDVGLQEPRGKLVSVKGEGVMRDFAVISMRPRRHSMIHHVLPDGFQLVQRRIF